MSDNESREKSKYHSTYIWQILFDVSCQIPIHYLYVETVLEKNIESNNFKSHNKFDQTHS